VSNLKNGILLRGDASEQLFSHTVRDAILAPQKLSRWGKAALQSAGQFDRKKCAEKLFRLYQSVIDDSERYAWGENGYLKTWEKLLAAIRIEWDLVFEKAKATIKTVGKD